MKAQELRQEIARMLESGTYTVEELTQVSMQLQWALIQEDTHILTDTLTYYQRDMVLYIDLNKDQFTAVSPNNGKDWFITGIDYPGDTYHTQEDIINTPNLRVRAQYMCPTRQRIEMARCQAEKEEK